ncbi:hypothetical protein V8F33_011793 [Rhypophila sp. PSN 637]
MGHIGFDNWKQSTITMIVWLVVSGIFVFARLATRYRLGPDRLGYDDWILLSAWICAVIKGVLNGVSFFPMFQGWSVMDYYMSQDPDFHFRVEILFGVGLFFGALEEALVRSAVIAFLYRLAVNKWHKRVLIVVLIPTICLSVIMAIMYLELFTRFARNPFNPNLKNDTAHPSWVYFCWSVFTDFFCALFPTFMLRNVRMKGSRKFLICGSLGLTLLAAGCGIAKLYLILTWTPAQDVIIGGIVTFYERGIFMVCVSIPALLPLWSLYRQKRRRRRALRAGDPEAQVMTIGGGGLKQKGAPGDGVINDPRMDALLVDTVPTRGGQSMSEKGSRLVGSRTAELDTSVTRPEIEKIESETTEPLVATDSSQTSAVPSTRP